MDDELNRVVVLKFVHKDVEQFLAQRWLHLEEPLLHRGEIEHLVLVGEVGVAGEDEAADGRERAAQGSHVLIT